MKMIHVLLLVLGFAACAPAVALEWVRPGAHDPARFPQDRYTCLREATYTGGFMLPIVSPRGTIIGATSHPTQEVDERLFVTCMQLRGWTLRAKTS